MVFQYVAFDSTNLEVLYHFLLRFQWEMKNDSLSRDLEKTLL